MFSVHEITSRSGNHLEDITHALIACLMYKLIATARRCDDFSIGFHRSRDVRKQELTINKNIKGQYHVRNYLKDIFGLNTRKKEHTGSVTN